MRKRKTNKKLSVQMRDNGAVVVGNKNCIRVCTSTKEKFKAKLQHKKEANHNLLRCVKCGKLQVPGDKNGCLEHCGCTMDVLVVGNEAVREKV